jgi:nicotinate-nucleotide adenylyltransferase
MANLIGVFGGTFDPPHIGHLILAEQARVELDLAKVLWVVTGVPPHKPNRPISPLNQRLAMVELAIGGNSGFQVSKADIDRDPPHFAHGTLAWLQERSPGTAFAYLMGSDSLFELPQWNEPDLLLERVEQLVVMRRPGAEIETSSLTDRFPALAEKLIFLHVPQIEISGQVIRENVRTAGPFRYFVPGVVYTYIEKHELYR